MSITREELETLMSDAEDDLLFALNQEGEPSERDRDLLTLFRRMVAARFNNPNATFEDMVNSHRDLDSPDQVRAWWTHWS
ncbi:hypothetical protein [Streptomyces griseus]|uniref:hypothetical protein n=1 Tax=Streptomyces griseus TaxID=1911 RepID=UPI0033DE63C2